MGRLRERRDKLSSEASDAQPLDTKAVEAMARKKERTIMVRNNMSLRGRDTFDREIF